MERTLLSILILSSVALGAPMMVFAAPDAEPHERAAIMVNELDCDALVELFRQTPDAMRRSRALHAAVRLLRKMDDAYPKALTRYALLDASARSADERKVLISGLSEIEHPAALWMLAPYLNDDRLHDEALHAIRRIADELGIDLGLVKKRIRML